MQKVVCTIHPRALRPLGDLFGLFFEDLNHAADGGLYAELVQNRSFEFAPVDHPDYHALTAWETLGDATVRVEDAWPLHPNNPHYAHVEAAGGGLRNVGFGGGMVAKQGAAYLFSCYARAEKAVRLTVSFAGAAATIHVEGAWARYEATLVSEEGRVDASLCVRVEGAVDLDMVSLFPADTYRGRPGGLRRDIAEALEAMRPKFFRFPGGCLIHDGTLDPDARDSMYRWKNTIGPVAQRPARRNGWRYNQTLGLGFYECFLFCEDIGAKPLPVLPGGTDPHHKRAEPLETLQPWIDDALDLIEFATGAPDTPWGARRAEMGHPAPFALEMIGIGNEEVGDAFFERLPFFVKAIRARYPWMKIIGTSGPFAAGGEYERGWRSARELGLDFVDEHYYQSPQWFLANMDRYHTYPAEGPRVFLGEYASWGNAYENALAEAAYMVQMQNAPAVALACYAPMLCNVDYVNWRPDMVWFDGGRVLKTANYHVQSLFMQHQGDALLAMDVQGLPDENAARIPPVAGGIAISVNDVTAAFSDIRFAEAGEARRLADCTLQGQEVHALCEARGGAFVLECTVRRLAGIKGVRIHFGRADDENQLVWNVGGWENQDTLIDSRVRGKGSCLTQSEFSMRDGHDYALRLEVEGRRIRTYIDGALANETEDRLPGPGTLHLSASRDAQSGDVILKAVNVRADSVSATLQLAGVSGALRGKAYVLRGIGLRAENTFENPDAIAPICEEVTGMDGALDYVFAPYSVVVFRLGCEGK